MTTPKKSNVMRLLEAQRLPYQAYTYSPEVRSAEEVAQVLGVPAHQVFKTLVVLPIRGKPLLVLIPGPQTLDLKRLAQAVGEKRLRMATQKEAETLTGLRVGGISALALLDRGFQIYVDRSAAALAEVIVSAGQRGMNLRHRTADFMRLTKARFVGATEEGEGAAANNLI